MAAGLASIVPMIYGPRMKTMKPYRPIQVNGTSLRWARVHDDPERIAELEAERDWLLCEYHVTKAMNAHGATLTNEQRVALATFILNPASSKVA